MGIVNYSFRNLMHVGPDSGRCEVLGLSVFLIPISLPLSIASHIDSVTYGKASLTFSEASTWAISF
jgi:hypothetical protein